MQVRAKAVELGELEERYWHDFNDFQIQLRAHVDERDVLLRKVAALCSHHAIIMHCGQDLLLPHHKAMYVIALTQLPILLAAPVCCIGSSLLPNICILSQGSVHIHGTPPSRAPALGSCPP